jgi:hypothetical protein
MSFPVRRQPFHQSHIKRRIIRAFSLSLSAKDLHDSGADFFISASTQNIETRSLVARLPRAILFDPEMIGIPLQRIARLLGRNVDDFQDLSLWRRLTIVSLRLIRIVWPNVIMPMAFSNTDYLHEIRTGLERFEPRVFHFCLIAPIDVVHQRLSGRGENPANAAWEYRRAAECCREHQRSEFAVQIDAADHRPDEIADELMAAMIKLA